MKRRKLCTTILFSILFLFFLAVMDYPFVMQLYDRNRTDAAVVAYEEDQDQVQDAERDEMRSRVETYNARLASGTGMSLAPAFEEEDSAPEEAGGDASEEEQLHAEYRELLNVQGDGVMGRLIIPKIGTDLLIYHGTSEDVLEKGAGHLEGSSLPAGGESTHVCLSAHRGLPGKRLFTDLDQLEEGDLFFLDVLGERLCYRVEDVNTVLPEETEELEIREGRDLVTLITCTPYGINTHRLCVTGARIPYTEETEAEASAQAESLRYLRLLKEWGWLPLSVILIAVMGVMLWRYNKKEGPR